ncbi:PEN family class A beta-lactamase, Bpc-type [Pseudoduganella ginsengisoli]|uniref:Beta-lactamase n=1 Tax=Pseudoduganella ginsengisoli TaxID=1462440 RepID=A0A6L6Q3A9_9BURK|nr:class A beta-lactamase [Pseudoduganella ginsengisoli]MTW03976.1 class A beta-lactamase [Pseudoduganella ginsengisoli]
MTYSATRRNVLLTLAAVPFLPSAFAAQSATDKLAALEKSAGGRLGVAVLDTGSGRQVLHRADERFAFCSTFKTMVAAAILARSEKEPDLLARRIRYTQADLVTYSPETEEHVKDGMTVAELCEATIQVSDNSAANLLMKVLGGPPAVTAYARSIGDQQFRLDRWETELNSAIPGDTRDTTTPAAMMQSVNRLLLGDALAAPQRKQLVDWMVGTLTGNERIRAGSPAGATVADKTGTGAYGVTNDIGVVWPQGRAPLVVVVYYAGPDKDSKARSDVVATATKIALDALA